jgi:uncharacterized protein (DUF924 family)
MATPQEILEYWFGNPPAPNGKVWFGGGKKVDDELRARFGDDAERASKGELDEWASTPHGRLALVILLDQLPRNLFRGTARSFATDSKAQALAKDAVERAIDRELAPVERLFMYMPLTHAEDREAQREGVALFDRLSNESPKELASTTESFAKYARIHAAIVERFGRFPHRNALLGRATTGEEKAYLAEHPENFGAG